jgi:hypothetical protein
LVAQRLSDGGQVELRGGGKVVEAGDGQITGNTEAVPTGGTEHADGLLVAHRRDRVRWVGSAEERAGRGLGLFHAVSRAASSVAIWHVGTTPSCCSEPRSE